MTQPKVLFTVPNIRGYHLQNGSESCITPSGAQTLSLLMVPTGTAEGEEDFYLHLNLPPELDLPLPATTQIYHQPPNSYLIPRWDMEQGAFTRIQFPPVGKGVTQDEVDTFETILAQCTAFMEKAKPPTGKSHETPGKGRPGQIVLIDEDDGSVVGELGENATIVEDPRLHAGSKTPVEVEVSPDGKQIHVAPASEEYLRMANHPAYKNSTIVKEAAAASRLIVTGSSKLGQILTSGAESFTQKTKPAKPLEFTPATHDRVRKINNLTQNAAGLSSRTVGQAAQLAQNAAARFTGRTKVRPHKGFDEKNQPLPADEYKPGLLNKSMIAFSTIADGIAYGGKSLLTTSGQAATTVVGHRWGSEAGSLAADLAGGIKNVGLVYIDVTGVSRRAVIKSVAKGMVVGRVRGGGEVVVGGGDGGVIPDEDRRRMEQTKAGASGAPSGGYAPTTGEYRPVGGAPPKYSEK
ncbi:hypothetical protein K470DRAFT_271641 [Piedraia hortae CBS 480.64]|uniref:Senescence domain-containing protein n=1 Tax=Piedraia hortae CBS 480.64 TaxID=1314780 RepID=A0A6A7BVT7_9PEZI|nr:hypothetical protein K470DRAFT_271641 [Piedraia hortae CBS 480.64]